MNKVTDCQDVADDLATAVRKRYVEQVAFAGLPMAFKSNSKEMPVEALAPYQDALNQANKEVWRILWTGYEMGCTAKRPGKVPTAAYDPNKKCDLRCMNARGFDCVCSCGGAGHGMGHLFGKLR